MRRISFLMIGLLTLGAALFVACGDSDGDEMDLEMPSGAYNLADQPSGAAAMFVTPQDGDTVTAPFAVEMAAEGVMIVPAGPPMVGEAHFHIMVDIGCVDDGALIPGPSEEATAAGHRHFGTGVSAAELDLEPGTYSLCLQLADGIHQAFGATETITVTVE